MLTRVLKRLTQAVIGIIFLWLFLIVRVLSDLLATIRLLKEWADVKVAASDSQQP